MYLQAEDYSEYQTIICEANHLIKKRKNNRKRNLDIRREKIIPKPRNYSTAP